MTTLVLAGNEAEFVRWVATLSYEDAAGEYEYVCNLEMLLGRHGCRVRKIGTWYANPVYGSGAFDLRLWVACKP